MSYGYEAWNQVGNPSITGWIVNDELIYPPTWNIIIAEHDREHLLLVYNTLWDPGPTLSGLNLQKYNISIGVGDL